MGRNSLIIFTCILFSFPPTLYAKGEGTSSAAFLKIGIGAKSAALSSAYTASGVGIEGVYYNPASGICGKGAEFLFMGARYIADINFGVLGYKTEWRNYNIALLSKYLYTTMQRMRSEEDTGEESFGTSSLLIQCTAAKALNKHWAVGGSVKMIREVLEEEKATAFAADFGILYRVNNKVRIGASLQNVGIGLKFIKERAPLPLLFRVGVGAKLTKHLLLSLDAIKSRDEKLYFAMGAEVKVLQFLAFRAGYCTKFKETPLGESKTIPTGVSCGLGFELQGARKIGLDYAFVPFGDLGSVHRLSLSLFL